MGNEGNSGEIGEHMRGKKSARDRILDAAYKLFMNHGVAQVGVDTIVAEAGCAKASLYNQFASKEDLALAFMEQRETVWTRSWLEAEVRTRTGDPDERLLTVFDVFDEWFRQKDFEGCSFINILLESPYNSPINKAAARHLANIEAIIRGFAIDAKLEKPEEFAKIWHMMMMGSIVSAGEGNRHAAKLARQAGEAMLASWGRTTRARPKRRVAIAN